MYSKYHLDLENPPQWLTLLRQDLNLKGVGLGVFNFPAGKGYTYMHKHEKQDEVYIFLRGSGVMQINEEQIKVKAGDIIRIPPEDKRALCASKSEGIFGICAGGMPTEKFPRKKDSKASFDDGIPLYNELPPWYEGNKKVIELNKKLIAQREGKEND